MIAAAETRPRAAGRDALYKGDAARIVYHRDVKSARIQPWTIFMEMNSVSDLKKQTLLFLLEVVAGVCFCFIFLAMLSRTEKEKRTT